MMAHKSLIDSNCDFRTAKAYQAWPNLDPTAKRAPASCGYLPTAGNPRPDDITQGGASEILFLHSNILSDSINDNYVYVQKC